MKLALAVLALTSAAQAANPIHSLLKQARRLEEAAEEEEYAFLGKYKLKMLTCKSGETYVNPEDGSYQYSSVVFRLCPADSCDSASSNGCTSGYGDYVVGLNSFVEGYLEDKRDDMQQDDAFKVEEFAECREYEADQDNNNNQNGNNQNGDEYQYYVGPACTEDGTGVKLEFYLDETCTTLSQEITFEQISNGVSLPYSTGGLVSNYCESCYGTNDNGEAELSEMCTQLYENSGKCETNMEYYHAYGQQVSSCEFIEQLIPKSASGGGAGKVIGWLFFGLVVIGGGLVAFKMLKKKDERTASLMSS